MITFESLSKQAQIFEVTGAVAKIGLILKSTITKFNQVKLVQVLDTLCI